MSDRDLAQALEQRFAFLGERHVLDAAVAVLAPAAHEALRLEPVQVVRERRASDAHRLRHLLLRAPLLGAGEQQHLPRRHGAAGFGHRALEGLRDGPGGAREPQPDGRGHGWSIHVALTLADILMSKHLMSNMVVMSSYAP